MKVQRAKIMLDITKDNSSVKRNITDITVSNTVKSVFGGLMFVRTFTGKAKISHKIVTVRVSMWTMNEKQLPDKPYSYSHWYVQNT